MCSTRHPTLSVATDDSLLSLQLTMVHSIHFTRTHDDAMSILKMLMITDLHTIGGTCHTLRKLACPHLSQFLDVLRQYGGGITGSSAHAMVLGSEGCVPHDLNILVPHTSFKALDIFIPHPAIVPVIGHFQIYACHQHIITLSSSLQHQSVLHIILNAPTTADMVFMTTGVWLQQAITIETCTAGLVMFDQKLGCADDLSDNLWVEQGLHFSGQTCRQLCPMFWHHVEDTALRQFMD
ncbi:uncharacterized protein HD556DRAFT_1304763 [Suillus plorans]|uniref:Uncharacterized protein n=1 Tax=Suillus plorans TaxID=116603 RepID=A0A9P7DQP3_9AGAM|nr:uncharacterized protein HD556DRAFT_1304763 [Suillus plorans]KAG1800747.1 hypothetical protein HD556DRAFT_1304763 [Suillus plorans]